MVAAAGPFSLAADYYRIDVEGRRAQSATKSLADAEKAMVGDGGCSPAGDIGNFPDENPFAANVGSKYPESSPMGFAGGFYYARARYAFRSPAPPPARLFPRACGAGWTEDKRAGASRPANPAERRPP